MTIAALCGIGDSTIKAVGHWKSAVFLKYIRIPRNQLPQIARILASTSSGTKTGPMPM